jgi:integrase/recombinase XerC
MTLAAGPTADLKAWLEVRGDHPGPVFHRLDRAVKYRGEPGRLSDRSIGNIVPELGERAGLTKRVRAHGLRHEAITAALDRTNGNIVVCQKFSRHRDPKTLLVYNDNRLNQAADVSRLIDDD